MSVKFKKRFFIFFLIECVDFFKAQTNLACCCCSGVWSNIWNTRTSWPSKTEREPLIKTPGQSFSCIGAPQTQSNISAMKMCLTTTLGHLVLLPTMMKSEHWREEFVGPSLHKYAHTHSSSTQSKRLSKHLLSSYQTFSWWRTELHRAAFPAVNWQSVSSQCKKGKKKKEETTVYRQESIQPFLLFLVACTSQLTPPQNLDA